MKNTLYGIFIVLCLLFFVLIYGIIRRSTADTINYTISGKTYSLLVANTPAKWERGLMYTRKLENAEGMLFIFPSNEVRTFWNKNTLMDLKVFWFDGTKLVGETTLPSIEKSGKVVTVTSPSKVNRVVEIPR